jgi:hypothetical protein
VLADLMSLFRHFMEHGQNDALTDFNPLAWLALTHNKLTMNSGSGKLRHGHGLMGVHSCDFIFIWVYIHY